MARWSSSLFVLVAAAGLATAQEPARDPAAFERRVVEVAAHVRARTVLVFGVIGAGSGAVVDVAGTVVTNAHVVAGARYATLQWADGRTTLARRLGVDYGRDLAILVPEPPLAAPVPAFALADGAPAAGSWVAASGFPGGLRSTSAPTFSLGRVLSTASSAGERLPGGALDYQAAIRSDAPIFSGNSGGPLVDLTGTLVGINGAVDLQRGVSLSIPVDVARDRLERLTGGRVLLPGGQTIDPERTPLLRALYRATDAVARSLPQRVAEASRRAAAARGGERAAPPTRPRDALAEELAAAGRRHPRQPRLAAGCRFGDVAGVTAEDGLALTPIDHLHAVTVASRLEGRRAVTVEGRPGVVLAVSEPDDLALIRLPEPVRPLPADAPLRRVGSLIYVRGERGLHAAGVVSAAARPTVGPLIARIQQGVPPQVLRALELAERAAERLKAAQVQALLVQIRRTVEARRAFAGGTPPRSYARVISIDAPLSPRLVGAPVLDRDGRLIGPAVGVAHFGTSYVVPIAHVRRAFADRLPARPAVPVQVGPARLY